VTSTLPSPERDDEEPADEGDRITGELLDGVVKDLFEAGLRLGVADAHVDAPEGRRRLRLAADRLDAVVVAVRAGVFDLSRRRGRRQKDDPARAADAGSDGQ
jgi:hypothetical protein